MSHRFGEALEVEQLDGDFFWVIADLIDPKSKQYYSSFEDGVIYMSEGVRFASRFNDPQDVIVFLQQLRRDCSEDDKPMAERMRAKLIYVSYDMLS